MKHHPEWTFNTSSTPALLGFSVRSRTLSLHPPKDTHSFRLPLSLALTQQGYSYNKGNDFSPPPHLCFPNHRVGLAIEWRNCWGLAPNSSPPLLFALPYPPPAATSLTRLSQPSASLSGPPGHNRKPTDCWNPEPSGGGQLTDILEAAQPLSVPVQPGTWPGPL